MDNSNQQDIKNNQTFRRSRHAFNPAVMFYIRMAVLFFGLMLITVVGSLLCGVDIDRIIERLPLPVVIFASYALLWVSTNTGSLVETVHVDYEKQEIRVLRYTLLGRQRLSKIPFEGFYWENISSGRLLERLRLLPLSGEQIVICKGGLTGWTDDDFDALEASLSEIVSEDYWINKGNGKKYNVPFERARAKNKESQ